MKLSLLITVVFAGESVAGGECTYSIDRLICIWLSLFIAANIYLSWYIEKFTFGMVTEKIIQDGMNRLNIISKRLALYNATKLLNDGTCTEYKVIEPEDLDRLQRDGYVLVALDPTNNCLTLNTKIQPCFSYKIVTSDKESDSSSSSDDKKRTATATTAATDASTVSTAPPAVSDSSSGDDSTSSGDTSTGSTAAGGSSAPPAVSDSSSGDDSDSSAEEGEAAAASAAAESDSSAEEEAGSGSSAEEEEAESDSSAEEEEAESDSSAEEEEDNSRFRWLRGNTVTIR